MRPSRRDGVTSNGRPDPGRRRVPLGLRPDHIGRRDRAPRFGLPTHRRPEDVLRLALGIVALVLSGLAAHAADPTVVERNLFQLINQLPSTLDAPLLGVMQLGAVGAVPLLAMLALVGGRPRLARVIAAAGVAAWVTAKVVQYLVDEEPASLRLPRVVLRSATTPGLAFPASHVAVAAAMATVAGPFLHDRFRRVCWLGVALISIARVYVGLHLPVDVVGGLALGWTIGAAVNLAAGTPVRIPGPPLIEALLAEIGIGAATVTLSSEDRYRATTPEGDEYLVEVISADLPDQDWLYRLWRLAAYHELRRPTAPSTPAHRAAHDAHLSLAAERAGVRTPSLVTTCDLGDQMSVVVRRWVPATPLIDAADEAVTDGVLLDVWTQLAAAHAAGLSVRGLAPEHVLIDDDGRIWLTGWGVARASSHVDDRHSDIAELLVSLASRTDPDRAVRTAAQALGPAAVSSTLAPLQTLTVAPSTRRLSAHQPRLLTDLMTKVAALEGQPLPPPTSAARIAARNLLPLCGLGAAVYILLPRLARVPNTASALRGVNAPWLAAVVVAAASTYVFAAVGLRAASGQPLRYTEATAAQLAAAASNRVLPAGLGAAATNVRYLESSGLDRPAAVAAVVVTSISGLIVHTLAGIAAFAAVRHATAAPHLPRIDNDLPGLVTLAGVSALIGLALSSRLLRSLWESWIRVGARNLAHVAARPRRALLVLATNAGVTAAYTVAFDAALRAFGAHVSFAGAAAVYLAGSAVGAATPAPGGVGPFEAATVAGLGRLGVAAGPAVAGVITYRLITYWLPIAPGVVAFQVLRRRQIL